MHHLLALPGLAVLVLEKGALLEITQEVLQLELEHAGHEVGPVVVRLPGLQRLCDLAPGGVARHGDEHGALAVGGGDSSRSSMSAWL